MRDKPDQRRLLAEASLFATVTLGLLAVPAPVRHFLLVPILLTGVAYLLLRWPSAVEGHFDAPVVPNTFQPWVSSDELRVWPRDDLVDLLHASVEEHPVSVVTGRSGSGKTTLLRRLFAEDPRYVNRPVMIRETYTRSTAGAIDQTLRQTAEGSSPIIILDQFERHLVRLSVLEESIAVDRRNELFSLIRSGVPSGAKLVIGVRNEWLSELIFLGDLLPPLGSVVNAEGSSVEESKPTARAIKDSIEAITDSHDDLIDILFEQLAPASEIHPLEIQIIGTQLELLAQSERLTSQSIDRDLEGRQGAIDRHFASILKATPDPSLASRLLYVLSLRNDRALPFDRRELREILHEPTARIAAVSDELVRSGIIVGSPGGVIELRHDYVASYFETASNRMLEPSERDNLRACASKPTGDGRAPVLRDPDDVAKSFHLGWLVFSLLTAVTVVRTLGLGIDWTRWARVGSSYAFDGLIDLNYAPIAMAHTVWSYYVAKTLDNSYVHLRETTRQRLGSYAVLGNMVACVVAAYFFPEVWVASVSWGGVVLGIKMYTVGSSQVSVPGRREFHKGGTLTILNALVLATVGAIFAVRSGSLIDDGARSWRVISWIISLFVSYAGIELVRRHVTLKSSRQFLTLLAR